MSFLHANKKYFVFTYFLILLINCYIAFYTSYNRLFFIPITGLITISAFMVFLSQDYKSYKLTKQSLLWLILVVLIIVTNLIKKDKEFQSIMEMCSLLVFVIPLIVVSDFYDLNFVAKKLPSIGFYIGSVLLLIGCIIQPYNKNEILYSGLYNNPNALGVNTLVVVILGVITLRKVKRISIKTLDILLILINISVLLLTKCRSGLLGVVAFMYLYFLLLAYKNNKKKFSLFLIISTLLLLIVASVIFIAKPILLGSKGNLSSSRLELWKSVFYVVKFYPLIGGSSQEISDINIQYLGYDKSSYHNLFCDIAARHGIPLLLLFCAILIISFIQIFLVEKSKKYNIYEIYIALFILLVCCTVNLVETLTLTSFSPIALLQIFCMFYIDRFYNNGKTIENK